MDYTKYEIDKVKTGEKIKEYIVKSMYTYEDLADALCLTSPRVMYEWIKGKKLPSLESLINLAKILGCSMEDLIMLK